MSIVAISTEEKSSEQRHWQNWSCSWHTDYNQVLTRSSSIHEPQSIKDSSKANRLAAAHDGSWWWFRLVKEEEEGEEEKEGEGKKRRKYSQSTIAKMIRQSPQPGPFFVNRAACITGERRLGFCHAPLCLSCAAPATFQSRSKWQTRQGYRRWKGKAPKRFPPSPDPPLWWERCKSPTKT